MKFCKLIFICSLFVLNGFAAATRLGLKGKVHALPPVTLRRREDMSGTTTLNNTQNIGYYVNITLGGKTYSVSIDTGSSDLWVADQVPGSKSTGKNGSVLYASGGAAGPIKTAPLEFLGYTVPDQAFLEVTPDAVNAPDSGLIGLGPRYGSNVDGTLYVNGSAGDPPLDRIFQQNLTTPNYISFLLGRSNDSSNPFPGDLTVGEILPGYEDVSSAPKLNVTSVSRLQSSQHWQVLLDEDGFVAPNGSIIPITSQVTNAKHKNRAVVVLDTGFTFPQVPKYVADAIYANVTGALYSNVSGVGEVWTLPCDQELNITFKFGGRNYPVHPLDTSMDSVGIISDGNRSLCLGAFQPVSFDRGSDITYDIVFGMAFLRNVYTVINFGDFVDRSTTRARPYVQLLSTTNDTSEAHADFVAVRLNGTDTTSEVNRLGHSNPSNPSRKKSPSVVKIVVIAVVLGLLGLIATIALCWFCGRRFLNRRRKPIPTGAYQSLSVPAPAQDLHIVPNAVPPAYNPAPGYNYPPQQYQNPWEQRY